MASALFVAVPAEAQTPSNTWIATSDGVWSNGANWDTAAAPVPGTTTILQFNANGATGYTATNDVADPFQLQGLIFRSNSTSTVTLAGNVGGTGSGPLQFAAATPFVVQNGTGPVVLNNNMTTNNTGSASDLNFGGYGGGTITVNGAITGVGGLQFTNLAGATVVLGNPGNNFLGTGLTTPFGTYSPFGTIVATASSGTPLGGANVILESGTIAVAPGGTGAAVSVGLATGKNLNFFAGGTLVLDKGANTSLTFNVNQMTYTLTGNSSGTMVLAPGSGIAALGTPAGESLVPANGLAQQGGTTVVSLANGMMAPTNVGQASRTDSTGDYLTLGAPGTTGVSKFTGYANYGTPGGTLPSGSTTPAEVSNVIAATTVNATTAIQAVRVTNTTLTIAAGSTLTIGGGTYYSGRPNLSGILLNNATIAGGGTLDVGANEIDLYAGAGTSTISAPINSTNASTASPPLVKFGPGNVVLTNPANSFAAGAAYTLYGGALVIPGPGGTNPSTVLGTGAHTFVMRGGAFGITGGDYAPASGTTTFLVVQGGGGFFVDAGSTLTLAQTGQLSSLGSGTGTGPLYKTGAGTLVLGFGYNLNGVTGIQVNQGQVQVNAAITGNVPTSTGGPIPVVVNNSGTIAGTGSVPGNVVINPGGTLSPGTSIGTLSSGGLTLQPAGTYRFEYNPGAAVPVGGVDNDTISAPAGTLDLAGLSATNRFVVNLTPAFPATPPGGAVTYTAGTFASTVFPTGVTGPDVTSLFTFAGAFAGTPTAAVNSGVLTFTFTPVPEPGLVLLACGAAAGCVAWRRSRRPG